MLTGLEMPISVRFLKDLKNVKIFLSNVKGFLTNKSIKYEITSNKSSFS